MITEFVVAEGERTKRLDAFLVSHERKVSRTGLQRLITAGRIRVNADVVKSSRKIKPGDRITIDQPEPGPLLVNNEPVPLEILYEDLDLLVIHKPAGLVVHPTSGHWNGTLLNGLLHHLHIHKRGHGRNYANGRLGFVHRLDKETSGVMVVAKTDGAHRSLCSQFEEHTIVRRYEALVYGKMAHDQGTIHLPIGRDVMDGKKVSCDTNKSQSATTEYQVLQHFGAIASRVELTPLTGRQHQLRVHMASLGCPVLGDSFYGRWEADPIQGIAIARMMLHARMLKFRHPISQRWEEFSIPCPPEMDAVVASLESKFE